MFGSKAIPETAIIQLDTTQKKTHDVRDRAYIYLIQLVDRKGNRTKYVKIGRTKRPVKERLADLQTGCPFELQIRMYMIVTLTESKMFEKYIHEHFFGGKKVRNEWFELTEDDIQWLISWLERNFTR